MMFDYGCLRAREARLGKKLGKIAAVLLVLAALFAVLGGYLIFLRESLCWVCFSLAILFVMLYYWTKKELVPVPVRADEGLNGVLSNDVLAAMPREPKITDLAAVVSKTNSGQFMAVRYGITRNFLSALVADFPEGFNVGQIFEMAMKIREGTDSEELHGAVLTAAIIASHPASEIILKQMRLEMKDVLDGVVWFNYLNGLVRSIGKREHRGGIARDLSFGYIPTLQKFGQNVSAEQEGAMKTQIHQSAHKEIVEQMISIFSSGGRQNVALIGAEV